MYIAAYAALLVGLVCSLGCGGLCLLQLQERSVGHLGLVKKAQWAVFFCVFFASAALLHALFWQDYQLEYVASYTDMALPAFYRLTAFWAGQPGSLLFWAFCCSISAIIWQLLPASREMPQRATLWFWLFYAALMAFFLTLLTGWSNPFVIIEPAPLDGQGLNPLLQNPGMIIHPPLLFIGYALFAVPGCLGLASVLSPEAGSWPWLKASRGFILVAWLFLTAGILLGAWWAYMELGWGGYWGWDPVENASLLPWLSGTAALHVIAIHRRSGKLENASALLLALTVILAFFATYLTRSGILQSVHAFGDGGVGSPLLCFVLLSTFITFFVCLSTRNNSSALAQPFSREGCAVLTAWLFLALAAIIMLATIWPVISKSFGGPSVGLEPAFYNRACLPLGAAALILLAICPWLGWTGGVAGMGAFPKVIAVGAAFAISAAGLWLAGYTKPLALLSASAAIAILAGLAIRAFSPRLWRNGAAVSAWGAHLGLALVALGIAFSGPYTTEKEMFLSVDKTEAIGPCEVTLKRISEGEGPGYDSLKAVLLVSRDGREVGTLAPERRIYAKFGSLQFSEVDLISSLTGDIYASLLGIDEEHRVLVKVSLEPLVNWIWIGGALLCLLPLGGLFIRGRSGK